MSSSVARNANAGQRWKVASSVRAPAHLQSREDTASLCAREQAGETLGALAAAHSLANVWATCLPPMHRAEP